MIRRVGSVLDGLTATPILLVALVLCCFVFSRDGDIHVTGTANRLPKFTGPSSINDSSVSDNGSTVSMTEPLDMGAHQIHNVVDPSIAQDAMTLNYANAHYAPSGGALFYDTYLTKTLNLGNFTTYNDINLGALGTNSFVTLDFGGTCGNVLTGFSGGVAGKIVTVLCTNKSGSTIQIAVSNAGSLPANQFLASASFNINNNTDVITFLYHPTLLKWLVIQGWNP
jgi:hypothetical protein